jgi:hypothetical protein
LQKIGFIWLIVILTSGCSVFKRSATRNNQLSDSADREILFENVERQNITANSFYIQKADIEINTPMGSEKFLGSLKFEKPDKYLLSIFISKDTILVNDRINRKMYYGSADQMNLKYGVSFSEIPLIFGDFALDTAQISTIQDCSAGKINIETYLKGTKGNYVIDCRKGKLAKALIINGSNKTGIEILYTNYLKHSSGLLPGVVQMNDLEKKIEIKLKIRKIEAPWIGKVEFIPGKQYENLQLP